MKCSNVIVPGFEETNKIKNPGLEAKIGSELDKAQKKPYLDVEPQEMIRLYRASSPTVKFSDVFNVDAFDRTRTYAGDVGSNPKGLKGKYYTPDYDYAEYFKETYGPDATIKHIDIPRKDADKYKTSDLEYIIPKELRSR